MRKKIFLSFLLITLSISILAQHSIQSTVFDSKNGQAIEMGTVRLLRSSDSTLVQGCQTDLKGSFIISKVKPGNYILVITNVGYIKYLKNLKIESKDLIIKSIQLVEDAKMLSELEVKGTAAQMVVKGDTVEYNATAFKTTENAVVEDLLKRLPGVEVDTDGKITINGEEIKKIRVNGKKFFGNDVEMATKNIPAELIEKIQVLEQKSEMAQLTGFEDNDTERIINLTFKPNRNKGTFGNVSGGAGVDTKKELRYDGNLFLNFIDGEAQSTITAGANNTNTTRSARSRGWSGGSSSGLTTMQNVGVNNNTLLNEDLKIGGDGSFNHSENENITESNRESYLRGSKSTNNTNSTVLSDNYSANLRLEMEWKIDSLNTIIFQPNIGYDWSTSSSKKEYTYLTDSIRTSWGNTNNFGNDNKIDGGFSLIYSHKFPSKAGRTFTTNFQTNISQSDSESRNYSHKITQYKDTIVDQQTINNSNRFSANIRMSFVEPLWNLKNFLEATLSIKNTQSIANKYQYKKDSFGEYSMLDSVYSNSFKNQFYSETLELNYRFVDKVYNLMLGVKAEPSQTYSMRIYQNGTSRPINNEIINYAPTARFQFNFAKKKFARLDYRGQTEQPSISQMQPVKNNSNLMNETVGNPLLNPSFSHYLRMMYTSFNSKTFSSFNAYVSAQLTKDALVSNSIYDRTQKQYQQTVNALSSPYNMRANIMFNTPIIEKRLHFNTNTSFTFRKNYGYSFKDTVSTVIDTDNLKLGDLSSTESYGGEQQLSLTFTHDFIEIGARGNLKASSTYNNLNNTTSKPIDLTSSGNIILHLPYNINIGTDLNYTTREGYPTSVPTELIWNASFDKTLFNSKGVLSLKLNDILRQRLNIRQTIGDNYIQYSTYNTLTSYFILSFTYKINKFKGAKIKNNENPFEREHFRPDVHMPKGDGTGGGRSGGGRSGGDF